MMRYLYLDAKGDPPEHIECTPVEVMGAFLWFMWVKQNFSTSFPHLFKPASADGDYDMIEAMNAQIRASRAATSPKKGRLETQTYGEHSPNWMPRLARLTS
jgi:hypothetical protein